jgi:hypothetical protein
MKQYRAFLPLLLLALGACDSVFELSSEQHIRVDSIVAPDTIMAHETLEVAFFGTVGENRCWSFHRFRSQRTSDRLEVSVIARYQEDSRGCVREPVILDGATFQALPPHPGPFRLVVPLPGSGMQTPPDSLVHVVHVR